MCCRFRPGCHFAWDKAGQPTPTSPFIVHLHSELFIVSYTYTHNAVRLSFETGLAASNQWAVLFSRGCACGVVISFGRSPPPPAERVWPRMGFSIEEVNCHLNIQTTAVGCRPNCTKVAVRCYCWRRAVLGKPTSVARVTQGQAHTRSFEVRHEMLFLDMIVFLVGSFPFKLRMLAYSSVAGAETFARPRQIWSPMRSNVEMKFELGGDASILRI